MKLARLQPHTRRRRAMTLLEMTVSVSLLMVILLALYKMFERTQKVFRGSVAQVDVQEGARATVDLLRRDLEQAANPAVPPNLFRPLSNAPLYSIYTNLPANVLGGATWFTNLFGNFYVGTNWSLGYAVTQSLGGQLTPFPMGELQTNWFHDVFFHTHDTGWHGIGYRVANPTNALYPAYTGIGTLYRFHASARYFTNGFLSNYHNAIPLGNPVTNNLRTNEFQRVLDNVTHFQVRLQYLANDARIATSPTQVVGLVHTQMPSAVELELGIAEPNTAAQVLANPNPQVARDFLVDSNRAGRFHLFRLHVPIPSTQP
jgi:type II secretory pathway pseudopilin PulG